MEEVPLYVWTQIFQYCYNTRDRRYRNQIDDAIFVWFVALKNTSKKINQLLDDNFFFTAIRNVSDMGPPSGLATGFRTKKIHYLAKRGSYEAFESFIEAEKKHRKERVIEDEALLALIVEYRDPDFLSSFVQDHQKNFKRFFSKKAGVMALRRANARETNDMTLALLPLLEKLCGLYVQTAPAVIGALQAGKKFNFDAVIGFDWLVLNSSIYLWERSLLTMLDESQKRQATIIVPQGEPLRFKCLGSNPLFTKGLSNIWVQDKKPNECVITYRERFGKQDNKIPIAKETSMNGVTYTYDDLTTDNLYELIVKSSLGDKLFGTFPHEYVAITKEALELPLDEQPWFVGYIEDDTRKALAADAPNSVSFFTFSNYKGEISMQRTETEESQNGRTAFTNIVELNKMNKHISKYIPDEKIAFGISNNRCQKQLQNHFMLKYIREGNFEKLKQYVDANKVDLASYHSPNLISACAARETINEDILLWLLRKAPLEDTYSGTSTSEKRIIATCSEDVIRVMIDRKRSVSPDTCHHLIERGVSYDLIKHCIQNLSSYSSYLISSLCTAIEAKKIKAEDYTKRLLVKTAWKFGNEDNYFKLLPKELIDQILSHEDIDEPPYFDTLFSLAKRVTEDNDVTDGASEPFMKFFWKNWGTLYTSKTAIRVAQGITRKDFTDDKRAAKLLYWFKRILTCPKLRQPLTNIDSYYSTSNLTLYCMKSSNDDAVSTLEFILQQKITVKEHLLEPRRLGPAEYPFIPTVWVAVLHKNVKMIKFLIENDMLPETVGSADQQQKISDLYLLDPTLDDIKAYIAQCRKNMAQQ